MITFAAEVLRTALDDGKGRVIVVEPPQANDNESAEVIPIRAPDDEPKPR